MSTTGGRSAAKSRTLGVLPGELVELDDKSAVKNGGGVYVPWPQPHARNVGVTPKTSVSPVLHSPTGAIILLPPGVDLGELTTSE